MDQPRALISQVEFCLGLICFHVFILSFFVRCAAEGTKTTTTTTTTKKKTKQKTIKQKQNN